MTDSNALASYAKIDPWLIGFDNLFNTLNRPVNQGKYPPYNIKKINDEKYVIELAVAGFSEKDISLTFEKNELVIEGVIKAEVEGEFVHQGIANRAFKRTFTLADNVEVDRADMENGMLVVDLKVIIPESQKKREIPIGGTIKSDQFLTEEN